MLLSFFIEIPYIVKFKASDTVKLDNEVGKEAQWLIERDSVYLHSV